LDKKPPISKWLAIGIILLFIGVTIAPAINFQVVKASQQSEIKGRITTLGHQQVQHRQIPLFTSVLKNLRENISVPSCYFSIAFLVFLFWYWVFTSWEGPEEDLRDWIGAIVFAITWPITIPLLAIFIIAFFLILGNWQPYKSLHSYLQYRVFNLIEKNRFI